MKLELLNGSDHLKCTCCPVTKNVNWGYEVSRVFGNNQIGRVSGYTFMTNKSTALCGVECVQGNAPFVIIQCYETS